MVTTGLFEWNPASRTSAAGMAGSSIDPWRARTGVNCSQLGDVSRPPRAREEGRRRETEGKKGWSVEKRARN